MIHNTEYSDHTRQKIETLQEHLYYVELDFLQIFRPFCFAVFEIFDWQIFDFTKIGVPYKIQLLLSWDCEKKAEIAKNSCLLL